MFKPLWTPIRWILSIVACFYVGQLFFNNPQFLTLQYSNVGLLQWGSIAFGLAIAAQIFAAWLWGAILQNLQYTATRRWSIVIISQNQLGKYLPGSIWHLVGRVQQSQQAGVPWDTIALSLILEPLFFIVGALVWSMGYPFHPLWEGIVLVVALVICHPKCFNLLYKMAGQAATDRGLSHYPFPELGLAVGFMGIRCAMFLAVLRIFQPIDWETAKILVGGFSVAWIARVVSPTPAGIGILEFTLMQTLGSTVEQTILLGAIALYRVLTLIAEAILAVVAYLIPSQTSVELRP
jgi:glycosyltransferase 2 family protein